MSLNFQILKGNSVIAISVIKCNTKTIGPIKWLPAPSRSHFSSPTIELDAERELAAVEAQRNAWSGWASTDWKPISLERPVAMPRTRHQAWHVHYSQNLWAFSRTKLKRHKVNASISKLPFLLESSNTLVNLYLPFFKCVCFDCLNYYMKDCLVCNVYGNVNAWSLFIFMVIFIPSVWWVDEFWVRRRGFNVWGPVCVIKWNSSGISHNHTFLEISGESVTSLRTNSDVISDM